MEHNSSQEFINRVAVAAIEHDKTRLWLLHSESHDPQVVLRRPDSTLMHVRGGQERHLHDTEAKETEYFASIAQQIGDASRIILFGHGSGNSNAMNRFMNYLSTHHSHLRERCVSEERIDFSAMTDGQLLALARKLWERQ